MQDLFNKGCLHCMGIKTFPRHLLPSNSFTIESENPRHGYIVDYIQHLHTDAVRDTRISIKMFFYAPQDDSSGEGGVRIDAAFRDFRDARELENDNHQIFSEIYGTLITLATRSGKNSHKLVEKLPSFHVKIPLVFYNTTLMLMMYTLDLHFHSHFQYMRLANAALSDYVLDARTLLLDNGKNRTLGWLLRTPTQLSSNDALATGTPGTIIFPLRPDMGE